jgi:hypothetical protein
MKFYSFLLFYFNTIFSINNVYSLTSKITSLSKKNHFSLDRTRTTSLIIESRPSKSSLVNLKTKASTLGYSFGMSRRNFIITAFNKPIMTVDNSDDYQVLFKSRSMTIPSLKLNNNFKYGSQRQWRMVLQDNFNVNNTEYKGWDYGVITKCGSYHNILGGHCQLASQEIKKEITNLPPHQQIKIEANFHFIGNWMGETGYLKINGVHYKKDNNFLWTYRCNRKNSKKTIMSKACGYNICLLNYPVSVTHLHSDSKISISFGTSLSNNLPCDRSYGISYLRVYIQ